jgi:hypothetical protein
MYTFFFTEASPFSQWYRCSFSVDGQVFNCAEQYMMYGKALLFGDGEVAREILAADHPRQHKALGRKVKGFDDAIWRRERERIVLAANRAKFTQSRAPRVAAGDARDDARRGEPVRPDLGHRARGVGPAGAGRRAMERTEPARQDLDRVARRAARGVTGCTARGLARRPSP